jgi:hypothetical protein
MVVLLYPRSIEYMRISLAVFSFMCSTRGSNFTLSRLKRDARIFPFIYSIIRIALILARIFSRYTTLI